MKYNVMAIIINFIVMAVVDGLMFFFIKDWTNAMKCSVITIDLAFVLNAVSMLINIDHRDGYVFQASGSMLCSTCILLEIIITVIACFVKIAEIYFIVAEILILILFFILFISNTFVNKKTAATIDINDDGIARIKGITATLKTAMNAASDAETKKKIEYAYDKSRSITCFDIDALKEKDTALQELASKIFDASKNNADAVPALCDEFCNIVDERAIAAAEYKKH